MDEGVALIICNACRSWTASTERGWRAYIADDGLEILCPCCAEVVVGEDEAAWSD